MVSQNIATWNIKRLNDTLKREVVNSLTSYYNLSILAILETRVKKENEELVFTSFKNRWSMEGFYYFGRTRWQIYMFCIKTPSCYITK